MEALQYFFRGRADGVPPIENFTLPHFLILLFGVCGALLIIKKRGKLIGTSGGDRLRIFLAFALLMQQIILYFWYGFSGYFSIQEGLPLYNCRFAIIVAAFALMTKKPSLQAIACYWGIFGSILALASPALDPFLFPHYTNFSFFGGHLLLVWAAFFILFVDGFEADIRSLRFMLFFTTIYHLLIYIFNRLTDANYCYLIKAPIAEKIFSQLLPQTVYALLVIFLWDLMMVGFYLSVQSIRRILRQEDEDSKFAF